MGIVVIYSKVLPFIYIILTKETVCLCISGYPERERESRYKVELNVQRICVRPAQNKDIFKDRKSKRERKSTYGSAPSVSNPNWSQAEGRHTAGREDCSFWRITRWGWGAKWAVCSFLPPHMCTHMPSGFLQINSYLWIVVTNTVNEKAAWVSLKQGPVCDNYARVHAAQQHKSCSLSTSSSPSQSLSNCLAKATHC